MEKKNDLLNKIEGSKYRNWDLEYIKEIDQFIDALDIYDWAEVTVYNNNFSSYPAGRCSLSLKDSKQTIRYTAVEKLREKLKEYVDKYLVIEKQEKKNEQLS